jgi:hypothetical protein
VLLSWKEKIARCKLVCDLYACTKIRLSSTELSMQIKSFVARYRWQLRIHGTRSPRQPRRGGPPPCGLSGGLTARHRELDWNSVLFGVHLRFKGVLPTSRRSLLHCDPRPLLSNNVRQLPYAILALMFRPGWWKHRGVQAWWPRQGRGGPRSKAPWVTIGVQASTKQGSFPSMLASWEMAWAVKHQGLVLVWNSRSPEVA